MKIAVRWLIVGLMVITGMTSGGCLLGLVGLLKSPHNNFAENLSITTDPKFGADPLDPRVYEHNAEEIYQCVNTVHLELVVNLSREAGCASGFVIKYGDKPHILTAGHVNTTMAKFRAIYAYFDHHHDKPEEVEIVVSDKLLDFALLRFKDPKFIYNGPYAKLGSSDQVRSGQKVYALGSPLGFQFYRTEGIIGKIEQGMDHDGVLQPQIIMHSAVINPGNSGGPLMDRFGRVIGINVMGINGGSSLFRPSATTTMSVAIPIDSVKMVLRRIKEGGEVKHSYLGLKLWNTRELNPLDYEQREVPVPDAHGLIVFLMARNSPAETAGLQKGDLILECDGKKDERACDIAQHALFENEPGKEIEFKILRSYSAQQISEKTNSNIIHYRTVYTKLDKPIELTIKVKPEVR